MSRRLIVTFLLSVVFLGGSASAQSSRGFFTRPSQPWVEGFGPLNGGWQVSQHPRFLADVNGDGRADVVGFGNEAVWVALSTGTSFTPPAAPWVEGFGPLNGGWQVSQHPRFLADVNGDGRADVVGFGNEAVWVALSTGTSFTPPAAPWVEGFGPLNGGWQVSQHPRFLADVNGDGRADVVGFGNEAVWVALSTGTSFTPPAAPWVEGFGPLNGGWQVSQHPRFLADVNGDGRADVVGFGNEAVWVALSTGTSFTPPAAPWVEGFGPLNGGWQVSQHPRFLADVNGDGRADVVGFGNEAVWVALSTGTSFTPPAAPWVEGFGPLNGGWQVSQHPRFLADVNGDGRADVVGFGNEAVWVALSTGTSFTPPAAPWVEGFGPLNGGWQVSQHPRFLADVNRDGKADVVGFGNEAVWVALSTTYQLQVRRFTTTNLSDAEADRILADATTVLQTNDGPGDVACPVTLVRDGAVTAFADGDGSVDSGAEFATLIGLPGHVKAINQINWCGGLIPGVIGCAPVPGNSLAVVRYTPSLEGILWSHEFGHNKGLGHRNDDPNAVMNGTIDSTRRRINSAECDAFLTPAMGALVAETVMPQEREPDQSGAPGLMDIRDFVRQVFIHGVPYKEASRYDASVVPTLLGMLNDPAEEAYWSNIVVVLGMIGDERAVEPLISFIEADVQGGLSREHYVAKTSALMALGYLINKTGNQRALTYLKDSLAPETWAIRDVAGIAPFQASTTERDRDFSRHAILGLALSGHPEAAQALRSLQQLAATETQRAFQAQVSDLVSEALAEHQRIATQGLEYYYRTTQP